MEALRLFAEIVDYPKRELPEHVSECIRCITPVCGQAAELLEDFRTKLLALGLAQVEELYTASFDMKPDCSPYIGHHLFGEDGRRNLFMARLNEEYGASGFERGSELPDHLVVLLRFLARKRAETETTRELIVECMVPALGRMVEPLAACGHPYTSALRALLLFLRDQGATPLPGGKGVTA
jgi:nitrate reductase molybdenum cofactor assembly chaperone NarJ/NarW